LDSGQHAEKCKNWAQQRAILAGGKLPQLGKQTGLEFAIPVQQFIANIAKAQRGNALKNLIEENLKKKLRQKCTDFLDSNELMRG
jgi:hypothetical protein